MKLITSNLLLLNNTQFRQALEKLAIAARLIRNVPTKPTTIGLFSFEDRTTKLNRSLRSIREAMDNMPNKIVNYICLGTSSYIRYWNLEPNNERRLFNKRKFIELPRLVLKAMADKADPHQMFDITSARKSAFMKGLHITVTVKPRDI